MSLPEGETYVVAANRPWGRAVFEETIARYPGRWVFVASPGELTLERLQALAPRYVFFVHWSSRVPEEMLERYECVGFHMTDLPYGRGGSPLQNLVVRGRRHTRLTALRLTAELDAGPVYMKEDLCLEGGAEEIYLRASALAATMIRRIVETRSQPAAQAGEPTSFRRRTPAESLVPAVSDLPALHDFIRMLDAEGYPRAFLEHRGFRFEFSRPALYHGRIEADVRITAIPPTESDGNAVVPRSEEERP